jgi:hydroxyacylglutathione hydrolase
VVIDVRQASEYADGHVPGAWHIAAGSLLDRLDDLPRDRPIVMMCASGYRSSVAASLLRRSGFRDVAWVASGLPAWEAQGRPVERGLGDAQGDGGGNDAAGEASHDVDHHAGHRQQVG